MNTEVVYRKQGPWGNFSVHVEGLALLMKALKQTDPAAQAAIKAGLKEAARPVLASAQSKARRIADDGTYASRMSVRFRANGSGMALFNNDPAAGVKEFARAGAKTRTSKGTPRADARLKARSGVGVPLRADAPRAMVPAVNENIEKTAALIQEALDRELGRIYG